MDVDLYHFIFYFPLSCKLIQPISPFKRRGIRYAEFYNIYPVFLSG